MSEIDITPAQTKKTTAILDAAKQHFAARGFEATKLSDIAKDAGVAVGTIYLRYEGKAGLLSGVLERAEKSFAEAMDQEELWEMPFPDRFHSLIAAIFATAGREEDFARLMALSTYAVNSGTHDKSHMLVGIAAHLRDGVQRNELRADVDIPLAARMAHGLVEGAMREMMAEPTRDPEMVITQIADASERWLCTR
ncbi:TetR/AcrR family transcriptional regulator [uncultured Sulfitobacter sp.]|uniref:TetR/AcrR family transcriptional regulator n=1 Tax=uncultured Sulfitobacter sp. TaxID=191468 RepID=UPI002638E9AD|nr:TetR/AcrR family transcriptional regulator [uncultured Sulfitobacter sp.]